MNLGPVSIIIIPMLDDFNLTFAEPQCVLAWLGKSPFTSGLGKWTDQREDLGL